MIPISRVVPALLLGALLIGPPCLAATVLPHSLFSVVGEPRDGLVSETDAGLTLLSGNTRSNQFSLGDLTSYRWPEETVQVQLRYLEANAAGVENASKWGAGARYERHLAPRLGAFAAQAIESDRFAGYFQRYATDFGVHRVLWKDDVTRGGAELGYRYQFDNTTVGTRTFREIIRAYLEASYRWNPRVFSLVSLEGLPDLANSAAWMLNAEASLTAELTDRLALTTDFVIRYSHLPAAPGLETTDRSLTSALTLKF